MRNAENTSDDITFNGVYGLNSPEFLQAIRGRAFGEDRFDDPKYMVALASMALAGPALAWFERQGDDVHTDWTRFRFALLEQFPESGPTQRVVPSLPTAERIEVHGLPTAGRIALEGWENFKGPSFLDKETWLREARARRSAYEQARPADRTSVYWILVEAGGGVPESAIQGGAEPNGFALFCARTWHDGGLHPGKIVKRDDWQNWFFLSNAPYIPFLGRELRLHQAYEVLVGDKAAVRWVENPSSIDTRGLYAVEGGVDQDGTLFLVGQAFRGDTGLQPGKIGKWGQGCEIGYYGGSHVMKDHKLLVWA